MGGLELNFKPGITYCVCYSLSATSVQKSKELHFLHAVVPKKVLAKDYFQPPNETSVSNEHVNE